MEMPPAVNNNNSYQYGNARHGDLAGCKQQQPLPYMEANGNAAGGKQKQLPYMKLPQAVNNNK